MNSAKFTSTLILLIGLASLPAHADRYHYDRGSLAGASQCRALEGKSVCDVNECVCNTPDKSERIGGYGPEYKRDGLIDDHIASQHENWNKHSNEQEK